MSQTVEPCDESDPQRESRSNPEDEDGRCTLDGLLLQMIHLIEDLELLHTQSALRIPAEAQLPRGRPYKALTRVVEEQSSWGKVFKIIRLPVNPILGYLRPVRNIFGSLVPDNLRIANRHWEHCLDLIVECANIKRELQSTIIFIEKLRYFLNQR
ncbi:uncharacterized protein LOC120447756 [Drosophila santomea]|uniref:uncharacterized protein LOC120447756 n=1 Tax=Drosophila santomea TaxID=129105 RepID=UPI001954F975|nr:uncharacterized protein LOC120447756 [Drosophila santomea]